MPARQTQIGGLQLTLDARPDRIDLRDRVYLPRLRSLPPSSPTPSEMGKGIPKYRKLILDQGLEGACTGYGLAAMINYLIFRLQATGSEFNSKFSLVSPQMLYRLAQLYDEWPGEDYEGSSCRGAMKGWHKHGVCSYESWQKRNGEVEIKPSWREEAPFIPLGAYYRINKDSISDMQSAIFETGAIYVSCDVFDYWGVDKNSKPRTKDGLPIIADNGNGGEGGGHAFCIVGYRPEGFLVQNSWGPSWGKGGFAILTYDEWVSHGADAWVATLGAPCLTSSGFNQASKKPVALAPATYRESIPSLDTIVKDSKKIQPIDPYQHMLLLGNDGGALQNRHIEAFDVENAANIVLLSNPRKWFSQKKLKKKRIVFYFHGGLNSENAAALRAANMVPIFLRKNIYPIFIAWQTGPLETIRHQLTDHFAGLFGKRFPDEGIGDWFAERKRKIRERIDRTIESTCRGFAVRGLWSEMKENAQRSTLDGHGMDLAVDRLAELCQEEVSIHLIGHSAGSIIIGSLLEKFLELKLKAASCHLYAPACTVPFAIDKYVPATSEGALDLSQFHIDLMDDERERADTTGAIGGVPIYGRSLLYLVSFALEEHRKTPLLGMENAWNPTLLKGKSGIEYQTFEDDLKLLWKVFGRKGKKLGSYTLHTKDRAQVATRDGSSIPLAHGSFDDDREVVDTTIQRILKAP